jgi:hypothetical protein
MFADLVLESHGQKALFTISEYGVRETFFTIDL